MKIPYDVQPEQTNKNTIMDFVKSGFKRIEEAERNRTGYTYFFPSLNEGKRLMIHGWFSPSKVAQIVSDIYSGKKAISDYPCVEETD